MKTRFKILTALMIALLLMAAAGCALAESSGTCGDNLTWRLDDEGTLTISGSGRMWGYDDDNNAPWYTARAQIQQVVLEEGVENIGSSAFRGCTSLTSVAIPDSVASIGWSAFYGCSSLTSVAIPEGVTTIGSSAFRGCTSLTSVAIPDSVTAIEFNAFYGCSSLTSVTIPESMTTIGHAAFYGCSSLSSVAIPEGVTTIRGSTFYGCSSLTSVSIPAGVTTIGNATFYGCTSLTSVTIPESVTTIESFVFSGCSSLTSVAIPAGVTAIESSTFSGCSSLTSVTIPESVTNIGSYTFYNCSALTSVAIPEGVTTIGERAFSGCSSLTSVAIPEGVTTIEVYTFSGCSSLTSVVIPGSVTTIGRSAFYGCSSLTSMAIPEGVTTIEYETFRNCTSLSSVAIPEGVTTIEVAAFYGCSSLSSVAIPDSVTTIGSYVFSGCSSLASVAIPEGVTTIGSAAFADCSSLTSVAIPDSVTTISEHAFEDCYSLTSVAIPESVTNIKSSAFYYCNQAEITLPDGITSIGNDAFYDVKRIICNPKTTTSATLSQAGYSYSTPNNSDFMLRDSGDVVYVSSYTGSKYNVMVPAHVMCWSSSTAFVNLCLPTTLDAACSFSLTATNVTVPDGVTNLGTLTLTNVEKLYLPDSVQEFSGLTCSGTKPVVYCSAGSAVEAWARFNGYEICTDDWGSLCTVTWQGALVLDVGESSTVDINSFSISPIPADYRGEITLESADMAVNGTTLTALKPGDATVNATLDGKYSTCFTVHVYQPVERIVLNAPSLCQAGNSFTVSVQELVPEDISGRLTWYQDDVQVYAGSGTSWTLTAPAGQTTTVVRVVAPSGASSEITVRIPETISAPYLRSNVVELGSTVEIGVDVDGETWINDPSTYGNVELGSAVSGLTLEDGVIRATGLGTMTFRVMSLSGSWTYLTVTVQDTMHAYRTQVPAQNPTCAEPGNTAYEICMACGRFFNPAGEEIEDGSWIIPVTNVHHKENDACRDCGKTFDVTGLNVMALPSALSTIRDEAFTGVTAQVIVVPQGCKTIGERAFANCAALQYIFLPAALEENIPDHAFDGSNPNMELIFQ